MPSRWYRSLYWRIAIGFMLGLAAMLVVQAMLFVWVVSRAGPTLPGAPDRLARTVALELGQALESDPQLDVQRFIRQQFTRDALPFFIVFRDDRVVGNTSQPFPEPLLHMARIRLRRSLARTRRGPEGNEARPLEGREPDLERDGRDDTSRRTPPAEWERRPGRFWRGGPRDGGFPGPRPVPVVVNGEMTAVVMVMPRAPFGFLLQRYASTLAIAATGVMVVGGLLASVTIFGPARRRLRAVEDAARRLGSGDLSARAPDRGGDEVAAVAAAFNSMASDLAARAEALAAADRARRQLLADVSHELTTPVTAMRGYLETLTMPELALDEETRARYLSIVGDETARLERIIGDLLDLARLEGGGGTLAFDAVPVSELFARVAARHERESRDRGIEIRSQVDPNRAVVWGDRDRLEQALQNLAANAMRYAPEGSIIDLVSREAEGGLTLSVSDQGPGIAPEHLAHVFDRFYKAEPARPAHAKGVGGGSGLGLSIVKAIVERHGGRVTVESRPGGTTFSIAGLKSQNLRSA